MATLELGPVKGEMIPWTGWIGCDDWIIALSHEGSQATLVYASDPAEDPWIVSFEAVSYFYKNPDVDWTELPDYVVGADYGALDGKTWLVITDSEERRMFEVAYEAAKAQKLEWVRIGDRTFDGRGLHGNWKFALVFILGVVIFAVLYVLYELRKH